MNGKVGKILACAAGGIVIAMLLAAALLSPRTDSHGMGAVALSREPGFYDDEFDLELSFDGGRIYYTLDSSDPDENATLYEGPIHISDASANPNVYAMNTDVCLEFYPEQLLHSKQQAQCGYVVPEQPVDKATVVRAVGIDANGNRSEVTTGVYFVGFGRKTGYEGKGIIAITTDPDNLFDPESGIYVLGKSFSDQLGEDGMYPEKKHDTGKEYLFWKANYRKRGVAWERKANIYCFDADRNLLFSGDYGIRIQGRASRAYLPKSFNIFVRKQYGTGNFSGMDLFGEAWQPSSVNLHSGAHAVSTKLNDYLINDLASDLAVDTRVYKPYELFLDGEYWGVYWLTPRYEREYFQYKYDVKGNDVVDIKEGVVEIGEERDIELYNALVQFITENDMSDPEMFAKACDMIDLQSWIDYYAAEVYIYNVDWPKYNMAMWRTRGKGSGAYADGKWRWILFDLNQAMIDYSAEKENVQRVFKKDKLFASLMKNKDFSDAFTAKLVELSENNFNPDRVETWIRDYEAVMVDAMEKEYARYYGDEQGVDDFIERCESVIRFFRNRSDYIRRVYMDVQAEG